MRRWWLIALFCACDDGSSDDGSSDRLVDKTIPELDALCTEHELVAWQGCGMSPGGVCMFLLRTGSCREIMLQLPSGCGATSEDYIACAQSGCSNHVTQCSAFSACGVTVYTSTSSSCG